MLSHLRKGEVWYGVVSYVELYQITQFAAAIRCCAEDRDGQGVLLVEEGGHENRGRAVPRRHGGLCRAGDVGSEVVLTASSQPKNLEVHWFGSIPRSIGDPLKIRLTDSWFADSSCPPPLPRCLLAPIGPGGCRSYWVPIGACDLPTGILRREMRIAYARYRTLRVAFRSRRGARRDPPVRRQVITRVRWG